MEVSTYYRIVSAEQQRRGTSLLGRVRGKCIDCVYDPAADGSMQKQVHECGCVDCPLYPFRTKVADIAAPPAELQSPLTLSSKQWQRKQALIRERQTKGTLKAAVEAMCIDCTFDPHEPGNWRQQVAACNIRSCPLWPSRPKSQSRK